MDIESNEFNGFIPRQKWFVDKIISSAMGLTLDCGCGKGLWSKKLREKGIEVIGVDISKRRLKNAKVERNNDLLICASCTHLPFKPNCFNSALLIEVIEHLNEEDQEVTLSEIHRVLNSEGTLIITTPNRPIYRILTKFRLFKYNPEHVHELSLYEFKKLVERYFKIVSVNGKFGSKNWFKHVPNFLCWDILIIGKKSEKMQIIPSISTQR